MLAQCLKSPFMPTELCTSATRPACGSILFYRRHAIPPVDETTALGEPRPGPEGRRAQPAFGAGAQTSWTGLVAMGAGVGIVFAVLGRVF